jgi:MinD superfamily P-loop ATPase
LQMTRHFHIPSAVCINKFDIFEEGSVQIKATCLDQNIDVLGQIPFDTSVTEAMVNGEPVTAYRPASPASKAINGLWRNLISSLLAE